LIPFLAGWAAVLSVLAAALAAAPPANAATTSPDTVKVTYTSSVVVTPTSIAGSAGDTFTFINERNQDNGLSYVSIVDNGGSVTMGGTPCTADTSCKVFDKTSLPYNSAVVTVVTTGTVTVRRYLVPSGGGAGTWSTVGTLTIGTGGSSGSTAPAPTPTFTLTYDGNGGQCSPSTSGLVATGAVVTLPLVGQCVRDGYTLKGFDTVPMYGPYMWLEPGTPVPVIGSNRLYAIWGVALVADSTHNQCPGHTTEWAPASGKVTAPKSWNCGSDILIGWSNQPDDARPLAYLPGQEFTISRSTTLWGIWVPRKTVTYQCATVPGTPAATQEVGANWNFTTASTCGGRLVYSWNTLEDGSGQSFAPGVSAKASEDLTLYAQNGPQYTVTWMPNGGTCNASTSTLYWGEPLTLPADKTCTRAGQALTGWNTTADGLGTELLDTPVTKNVTVYAVWKTIPVLTAQWTGSACPNTMVKATWSRTKKAFEVLLPSASGCTNGPYVLREWTYPDPANIFASRNNYVAGSTLAITADSLLYSAWNVPMFFDGNGGTCPTTSIAPEFSRPFQLPSRSECQRDGYALKSWALTASPTPSALQFAQGSYLTAMVPSTLYAQWARRYTLTFDSDGGTCSATTLSVIEGESYTLPDREGCSRDRYGLTGWGFVSKASGSAFLTPPASSFLAVGPITFVAQWTKLADCPKPPAAGVDWTGCDKRGAGLTDAVLTSAVLINTNFTSANLTGANLTGANLTGTLLRGATLTRAQLPQQNLFGRDLTGVTFTEVNLSSAYLAYQQLSGTQFSGADLRNANFTGANLSSANLSGANLTGANFSGANLSGANLSNAVLTNANLSSTNLSGANLTGSSASGVTLAKARVVNVPALLGNFTNADFTSAVLNGSRFEDSDLSGAKFASAELTDTDFTRTNLSSADFDHATTGCPGGRWSAGGHHEWRSSQITVTSPVKNLPSRGGESWSIVGGTLSMLCFP
jgi:uncharacterized protein YjbI with pentapeptide repeats